MYEVSCLHRYESAVMLLQAYQKQIRTGFGEDKTNKQQQQKNAVISSTSTELYISTMSL